MRHWIASLTLAGWSAVAVAGPHEGAHEHVHAPEPGRQAALDPAERDYWLELYARVVRDCSLDNCHELLDAVDRLSRNALEHDPALRLYAGLRERLPRIEVNWNEDAAGLAEAGPIRVAAGLGRSVLVELTNRTSKARVFRARFDGWRPSGAVPIAAGASRTLVTRLVAQDLTGTSIGLEIEDGGVRRGVRVPLLVEQPATVTGRVLDGETGEPIAARVFVRGGDGELRQAREFQGNPTLTRKKVPGSSGRRYQVPFSYTSGEFHVDVAPGEGIEVRVERGYEHRIERVSFDLEPGEERHVELTSDRCVDMLARGWVSADTHVHWVDPGWTRDEDIELLEIVQCAEDLRVVSNLTLQRTVDYQLATMPTHAPMGPVPGRDRAGYLIQMGEEFRNDPFYGHLILLNLVSLVQPISTGDLLHACAEDYPVNYTIVDEALRQEPPESRPAVVVAHGLRGSAAVDIATGRVDSIDQCAASDYYDLLDCGLRLPLTNGSDHPTQRVGWGRCYTKLEAGRELTYGAWIDGILRGATFSTSGPMLLLTVNGADVGTELDVAPGDELDVRLEVVSRLPVGRIELVANRRVVWSRDVDAESGQFQFTLPARESQWLLARASAAEDPQFTNERDAAHTSALYVTVDGAPIFNDSGAAERLRDACAAGAVDVYANGMFYGPRAQEKRLEARDYFLSGRDFYQALLDAR